MQQAINEHDEQYKATIIFLDLYMPEMDGFEATEIINNMRKKNKFSWIV